MGKLKEAFSEIMEDFDWKGSIAGISVAITVIAFFMGIVLAIDKGNCLWLLLWIVAGVFFGFTLGVQE